MPADSPPTLFVVSDGRGQTCSSVLHAALVQFEGQPHQIVQEADVLTRERVEAIVAEAARCHGVVFYTLVADEPRRALRDAAARWAVPVVDVLGPALSALHDCFHREQRAEPGLLYRSEREAFDRHDAIDFTLKHDDGGRPDGLERADVVLVGVSRSAKSSVGFYLAYHGVKAANVPLVPGMGLPKALLALPKERVIGLLVNPARLVALRESRQRHLGAPGPSAYTDIEAVREEVRAASRTMTANGWATIDASYMAVEEVAREIMRRLGRPERSPG